MRKFFDVVMCVAIINLIPIAAMADVFNLGAGQKSLEFVTVGDSGNAPDTTVLVDQTTNWGSVDHDFRMGKYEVTAAQYAGFLNAVAKTDKYHLYDSLMANSPPAPPTTYTSVGPGIVRSGSSGNYTYSVLSGHADFPVNIVTFGSAARFCNWLQNSQPSGAQNEFTTERGAYTLDGATSNAALLAVTRNPGALYFLPSQDEWYKSAYYKGGGTNSGYWLYPTQSNAVPSNTLPDTGNHANYRDYTGTGNGTVTDTTNYLTLVGSFSLSSGPYGTYDQAGNVSEWTEGVRLPNSPGLNGYRYVMGGDFNTYPDAFSSPYARVFLGSPDSLYVWSGFRVAAAVPEPSTLILAVLGLGLVGLRLKTRQRCSE